MISGTMPWASSVLMTPTCANPRAAPPPSASAILGAAGGAADLSGKFAHADKRARSAIGVARSMGYPEGNGRNGRRSEERRVGKECRARWEADNEKEKRQREQ